MIKVMRSFTVENDDSRTLDILADALERGDIENFVCFVYPECEYRSERALDKIKSARVLINAEIPVDACDDRRVSVNVPSLQLFEFSEEEYDSIVDDMLPLPAIRVEFYEGKVTVTLFKEYYEKHYEHLQHLRHACTRSWSESTRAIAKNGEYADVIEWIQNADTE